MSIFRKRNAEPEKPSKRTVEDAPSLVANMKDPHRRLKRLLERFFAAKNSKSIAEKTINSSRDEILELVKEVGVKTAEGGYEVSDCGIKAEIKIARMEVLADNAMDIIERAHGADVREQCCRLVVDKTAVLELWHEGKISDKTLKKLFKVEEQERLYVGREK